MAKVILSVLLLGVTLYYGVQWLKKTDIAPPQANPVGYARGLQKFEQTSKDTMHADNVQGVKDAVEKYKVEKNGNPPDLQSLVDAGYIDRVPQGVAYDPATGQVTAAQ